MKDVEVYNLLYFKESIFCFEILKYIQIFLYISIVLALFIDAFWVLKI